MKPDDWNDIDEVSKRERELTKSLMDNHLQLDASEIQSRRNAIMKLRKRIGYLKYKNSWTNKKS